MILSITRSVNVDSADSMNGSRTRSDTNITTILGTKVSVVSLIWVRAWNTEIRRPTARLISIRGPETWSSTRIASRASSTVSFSFIGPPASADDPGRESSDRHLEDVEISADHAVAHRDHGLQGHLGVRHRGHDVGQIGLAGDARDAGLLGHVAGAERLLGLGLDQVREGRARLRPQLGVRHRGARGVRVGGDRVGVGGVDRPAGLPVLLKASAGAQRASWPESRASWRASRATARSR